MSRIPGPLAEISRRFLTRLGYRHGLPIREGNAAALLEGSAWLEATEALICGATRDLCFEMYMWEDDAVGRRVLGWLQAAAALALAGSTAVCLRAFFFFNDTATTEIYTLSLQRRSSDLVSKPTCWA